MKHQLDYYNWVFGDYIEFVPLNGPYEVKQVYDQKIKDMFSEPFYAWYFFNEDRGECRGISDALQYILDYINSHGPFDGVFGFSQGTLMARLVLKLGNVDSIKFGILFSPVFSNKANYVSDNEEANKKLSTEFDQSMFYSYGEMESHNEYITQAVVKEGDYTLLVHKYGHNIPKFVGEDMKVFGGFLKRVYNQVTGDILDIGE